MKELGIVVLGTVGGMLLGVLIGSRNTVSKEKHHEVCRKYDAEIQNYRDYVIAIEKYDVIDSIKENPAVSVLRSKLNIEEEPQSYELKSYSHR